MGIYVAESGLGDAGMTRGAAPPRYQAQPTEADVRAAVARVGRRPAGAQGPRGRQAQATPARRQATPSAVPSGPRIVVPALFASPMLGSPTATVDRAKLGYWRVNGVSFTQTLLSYDNAFAQFDGGISACLRLANTFRNHPPASAQSLSNFRDILRATLQAAALRSITQRGPDTIRAAFVPLLAAIDREVAPRPRGSVSAVQRGALNVDWLSVERALTQLSQGIRLVFDQYLAQRLDALARGILAAS